MVLPSWVLWWAQYCNPHHEIVEFCMGGILQKSEFISVPAVQLACMILATFGRYIEFVTHCIRQFLSYIGSDCLEDKTKYRDCRMMKPSWGNSLENVPRLVAVAM